MKTQIAKAVGAALLLAASATAQADLVVAGNTRPSFDTAGTKVDGTVFFAVFDRDGGTATDPWGTGYNLTGSALPGFIGASSAPAFATTSQYLYVYQTYNNELGTTVGTNVEPIKANSVSLNPSQITSWGAFMKDPSSAGGLGTYIKFATTGTGSCAPAALNPGGVAPAKLCDAGGAGTVTVTIAADPGTPGGTLSTAINGLPTYSSIHLLQFGQAGIGTNSTVEMGFASMSALYLSPTFGGGGGVGPLLGIFQDTGSPPATLFPDVFQFGTVFFATSNEPIRYDTSGIIDGATANGLVPVPGGSAPEPMMLALLGSGLLLLGWSRRARKS